MPLIDVEGGFVKLLRFLLVVLSEVAVAEVRVGDGEERIELDGLLVELDGLVLLRGVHIDG